MTVRDPIAVPAATWYVDANGSGDAMRPIERQLPRDGASPLLPFHNECGLFIGGVQDWCPVVSVEPQSWSQR